MDHYTSTIFVSVTVPGEACLSWNDRYNSSWGGLRPGQTGTVLSSPQQKQPLFIFVKGGDACGNQIYTYINPGSRLATLCVSSVSSLTSV